MSVFQRAKTNSAGAVSALGTGTTYGSEFLLCTRFLYCRQLRMMPRAVARAASALKVARMTVEVLTDLEAANLRALEMAIVAVAFEEVTS